ncbi:MAG: VOC family protein [Pseudomonadota bacterium]
MAVSALAYLGVRSSEIDDWGSFAQNLLGMQKIDAAGKSLAFRMDDREQRLIVSDEPGETLAFLGFETSEASDLEQYAARLDANGVEVHSGKGDLADRRLVEDMIWFNDPMGNRVELVYAPMTTDEPFVPGRPIDGFKTGPFGMGHAVLHVQHIEVMMPFYRDLLDFRVSDYGLKPYGLYFFHINGRHHSFAMVGSGKRGFHHFMVEYNNLDDVGQGYDIAQTSDKVAFTLGRHSNDWMTSFYSHTPSGFFVETGWGGRIIDPETWEPHETDTGPSYWGHERLHLPDEDGGVRQQMRGMAMESARKGLRTPPVKDCPWLYGELAKQGR